MKKRLTEFGDTLTPDEARQVLGVGRNTIYSILGDGTLKSIKIGKKYIIPKTAILAFLNQTEVK